MASIGLFKSRLRWRLQVSYYADFLLHCEKLYEESLLYVLFHLIDISTQEKKRISSLFDSLAISHQIWKTSIKVA